MLRPDSLFLTLLLGSLAALGPLSMDIYLVSMPSMTEVFATDSARAQATIGSYMLGFAVGQLVAGPVSDRFGRRPTLLVGLAVFVATSLACAAAPTIEVLIGLRFFQAVAMCAGSVLSRAVVRDLFTREQASRMMSMMGMVHGLAPIAAPIIGSHLHVWFGWQASFLFVAAYAGAALAMVHLLFAETLKQTDPSALTPRRLAGNFAALLRTRVYVINLAAACCMSGGLMAFLTMSSFVFIRVFGFAEQNFGFLFGCVMLGNVTGAFISSRLVMRIGMHGMLRIGSIQALAAGLAMAGLALARVDHVAAVLVPMLFYMMAFTMIMPQAMAGALAPFPQMAGTASSLLGFCGMAFGSLVGFVVALAYDDTQLPLALAVGTMAALAFAACRLILRQPASVV